MKVFETKHTWIEEEEDGTYTAFVAGILSDGFHSLESAQRWLVIELEKFFLMNRTEEDTEAIAAIPELEEK